MEGEPRHPQPGGLELTPSLQPVMTESTCLRSSGTLVHALVNKLTSDILALEDITALESERLDALCQLIYPLEELFTSHQVRLLQRVERRVGP